MESLFPDHAAFDENPKTGGEKYFVRVQQKGKKRTFSQYNRTRQDNLKGAFTRERVFNKIHPYKGVGKTGKNKGTGDSFISAGLLR